MVKVGKWIAKHKVLVLLIGLLLVIPSVIGIAETRVNYDLLSYLPDTLETVKGQDILVDEYGMGAFSMVVVENMDLKDVQKLEEKFENVSHVKDVLWYDDVADISLPFVASIVIGAIQLGATVDYAILMTTRYQKERQRGREKMEAISIAHKTSMPSIISSGLSFFAATFGVACYSQVEMIGSICTLLARGAIISMIVVIMILPAMFMIFDKVICKTSIGFLGSKKKPAEVK